MAGIKMISELEKLSITNFSKELIDAITNLSIYETKIKDMRLDGFVYLPRLNIIEALSSMQIEGTKTTMEEVISSEIFPDVKNPDIQEIRNHNSALKRGAIVVKVDGFSEENIKRLHYDLMQGIKNKNKNAAIGEYKTNNNCIRNSSGVIVYNAPDKNETKKYMDDLINFMNKGEIIYHPLVNAAIIHAQFESIHPFDDGNGRLGRLLIPLYLYSKNVIDAPLFYVSEAIGKDKYRYYTTLQETRDGDYNEWIKYFLEKCAIQAKKHIEFLDNINKLYDKMENSINKIFNSGKNIEILKALFRYPIINSVKLAETINVSLVQAGRFLKELERQKVLFSDGKKRNTSYQFGELLGYIM